MLVNFLSNYVFLSNSVMPQIIDVWFLLAQLLSTIFRFSDAVFPVCLPDDHQDVPTGHTCIVSGWGHDAALSTAGYSHNCLEAAKVPLMSQKDCEESYQYSSQQILDSMICAGYKEGGVSACHGDSGGPLACLIDGKWPLACLIDGNWPLACPIDGK